MSKGQGVLVVQSLPWTTSRLGPSEEGRHAGVCTHSMPMGLPAQMFGILHRAGSDLSAQIAPCRQAYRRLPLRFGRAGWAYRRRGVMPKVVPG